jgi:hypothetical protein
MFTYGDNCRKDRKDWFAREGILLIPGTPKNAGVLKLHAAGLI